MNLTELLRVAGLVFVAVSFVVFGDKAGKLLTSAGVDPIFVAWQRFLIAVVILLPFSGLSVRELPSMLDWRVLGRACVISIGICGMLTALKTEPIANVFGAFFVGPVVSYVLAVLFLGETPSGGKTILLALGFVGVLLVVKPGFGASFGMTFALLGGFCYGTYLALTRTVAGRFRSRFLLISQLLIGSIILTPFGLRAEFPDLDVSTTLLVVASALGSALGNYLLVIVNRTAEASPVAPLIYTQLITATLISIYLFNDVPDLYAFIGLALIAVSGFGTLWLHQTAAKSLSK